MLQGPFGSSSYEKFSISHKGCVEEYLGNGAKEHKDEWSGSIAVGSKSFVEGTKERLSLKEIGREIELYNEHGRLFYQGHHGMI